MRHLYGAALAVAMAAAVFFAASWGYLRLLRLPYGALPAGGGSLIHTHAVLEGFGALLGVGLLAGLLIAIPWVSPLASGLPGLILLAWNGVYLSNVHNAVRAIPLRSYDYGVGFEALLFDGVLALAGLAMIIPMFVPSRWVRPAPAMSSPELAFDPSASAPTMTSLTSDLAGSGYTTPGAAETVVDNGGLLTDWAQTRPQAQIDPGPPNPQSQAPWGPADYTG
jgi:hypothetical protein